MLVCKGLIILVQQFSVCLNCAHVKYSLNGCPSLHANCEILHIYDSQAEFRVFWCYVFV